MALKYTLFITLLIGAALAQEDDISDALDSLPEEFQGKISQEQAQEIQNKTTKLFQEKCEKNGGPDAFAKVQSAGTAMQSCVERLVNFTVLKQEIEDAKPEGKIDEVFKKYCDKSSSFKACAFNGTEAVMTCFNDEERANLNIVYNITDQLAEFVCFKDGDRIALFIAEGGPDCIKAHQQEIQNCINKTVGADIKLNNESAVSLESLPTFAFSDSHCGKLNSLQECVVGALVQCKQPTTANIAEALFKFVRKATPCNKVPYDAQSSKKVNSATSNAMATSVMLASLAVALY